MIAVVDKESVSWWSSAGRWKLLVVLGIKRIFIYGQKEGGEVFLITEDNFICKYLLNYLVGGGN